MSPESEAEPTNDTEHPSSDPSAPSPADRRQGVFVNDDAVVASGLVVGVNTGTIVQDPDAPYDVRGLPNPYLGLRSFTYDDRGKYAGRERLVQQTVATLTAPGEQRVLLFVTGASGSGKSSFAQAGLIPALEDYYRARNVTIRHAVIRPSRRPLSQLADAFTQLGFGVGLAAPSDLATLTQRLTEHTALDQVNVIILDQFEELFSQSDQAEQEIVFAWLECLPAFASLRTHLIATMRSDYLPELFECKPLYDRAKQGVDLRAMTVAELNEAIQRPLQQARPDGDKRFEDALVGRLARDAAGNAVYLPLLQVTLEDLWSRGLLKLGAYGTLSDAIRDRAERVYGFADHEGAEVQPRSPDEQAAIVAIFLDLVTVALNDDVRLDVRRRRTWDELLGRSGLRARLVENLVGARLLSKAVETHGDHQVEVVDIIHETLISNWQRLRGWIDEQREALQQRVRFEDALGEWREHDQHPDYLLDGVRLAEAEALAQQGDVALVDEAAQGLLCASLVHRETVRRQQLQRARLVAVGLAILLLIALSATGYAIQQVNVRAAAEARERSQRETAVAAGVQVQREADARATEVVVRQTAETRLEQQLIVADSQRLAFAAQGLPASQGETGLLLAYEAVAYNHNPVTEQVLRDSLDRVTWQPVPLHGHVKGIEYASFSPDGQHIVTASDDMTARVWNLSGKEVTTLRGHEMRVASASFSPDGQHIVTASDDMTARVWDLSGKELLVLRGHQRGVTSASFSPDGQHIVTASDDMTARVWDLSGNEVTTLRGHQDWVLGISLSPDGQYISTASADTTARLWNLNGVQLAVLEGHRYMVTSVSFSRDGQHVVTASADTTARVWNLKGRELAILEGHQAGVGHASFSPDGQHIVTASDDMTARVWDLSGREVATLRGHQGIVTRADFSPDGQHIVTASVDTTARLWDLSGKELAIFSGHTDVVSSVKFSPDGQHIVTASYDVTARMWNLSRREVATIKHPGGAVLSASFSPDGQHIVTASDDMTARVWDLSGREVATLRGHQGQVTSVGFSPDGQYIVTASYDTTARVWDLSGREVATLRGHQGQVTSASFSPDGQYIVTASYDTTARVWDLSGREVATLHGHQRQVTSASFSPDGHRLVTTSWDDIARVWDLHGSKLATLRGHQDWVISASFSPDGQHIVTASWDGTARLWDERGTELATLRGHHGAVRKASFSFDGTRIVTTSGDGTARQYAVSIDDLLAIATCRVGRGLTDEEIQQFAVPTPLAFDFEKRQCPPKLSWQK